ncbi:unnamed protein product [Parajaminaea phylloscopi]
MSVQAAQASDQSDPPRRHSEPEPEDSRDAPSTSADIDSGASEPIPLDSEELESQTEPVDASAPSHGAWSVTATPVQESEGFGLGNVPLPQRPSESSSHSRMESLPPQRFADVSLNDDDEYKSSARFEAGPSFDTRHRPSLAPSMEEEVNLDSYRQPHASRAERERADEYDRSPSEFDRAGLDFVDVQLGLTADAAGVYGPGGPSSAATKSRTSLEIRTDSLSSESNAAQRESSDTPALGKLKFWQKRQNSAVREDGEQRPPISESSLDGTGERAVRSSQIADDAAVRADAEPPMLVADADGEVHVAEVPAGAVSREDVSTITTERSSETAARPSDSASAGRSGRSAGPVLPKDQENNVSQRDRDATRQEESPHGAGASRSKAGRSAGPQVDGPAAAASQPDAGPSSPSSRAAGSAKAAGRSAGPAVVSPASPTAPSGSHTRRLSSSNGPSALERYMSRTRQSTLPPKTPQEDQRHLQDFEAMMRASQASEAKRAKEESERQKRREEELATATRVWESEILRGDWRVARAKGTRLREIWWRGAPPSLRGRAWQLAIGNGRMLPRNLFTTTKARVRDLRDKKQWPPSNPLAPPADNPEDVEGAMDQDIERTLPSLKLFQKQSGVMYDELKEVLECVVLLRSDQARDVQREATRFGDDQGDRRSSPARREAVTPRLYEPGLSLLVAPLLLNLSESDTLLCVLNLLWSRPWLRSLYSMDPAHLSQATAFERVLNTLLADQQPKVYANLQTMGVDPSLYARDWVKTLFVPLLPFDVVCRLWDNIFLEEEDGTDDMVFRTCLALVGLLSSRLHVADTKELISVLQGRNRAALSVWYRMVQSGGILSGRGAVGSGRLLGHGAASTSTAAASSSTQAIASLPPDSPLKLMATSAGRSSVTGVPRSSADDEAVTGDSDSDAEPPTEPSEHDSTGRANANGHANGKPRDATVDGDAIEAPSSWVPRDALFSIYSIGEDALFSALEEQTGGSSAAVNGGTVAAGTGLGGNGGADVGGGGGGTLRSPAASSPTYAGAGPSGDGWWKESTLRRLIDRELGG